MPESKETPTLTPRDDAQKMSVDGSTDREKMDIEKDLEKWYNLEYMKKCF